LDDRLIGFVALTQIDYIARSGTIVGGFLDLNYRLRGYFAECIDLFLTFVFGEMNLHKVKAEVLEHNRLSWSSLQKFGFEREGVLRGEVFSQGRWEDVIVLGLRAEEIHRVPDRHAPRLKSLCRQEGAPAMAAVRKEAAQ